MDAGRDGRGQTAQRVLDVAERLLQARGYNGFSYADVAVEVGITRAGLHYHFPGKAELGQALITRYADRFMAALAELDATAPDAVAKLAGYIDLYGRVLQDHRMCLCGMLAAEYATLPTAMRDLVSDFFDHNTAWLHTVLDQGVEQGSITVSGSPDDVAAMLLAGLEGALLVGRLDGDVPRFRRSAAILLAHLAPTAGETTTGL
jgi:TetR/AcrR family transcriptional repressor of nem operon